MKNLSKGDLIKADLYSRPNTINGKYRMCQIGIEIFENTKDSNVFFLETLQMKANLADKMIAEAKTQGKDINNLQVMKELGEEINSHGTPIRKSEAVMTAIFTSLQLIAYYFIAVGIWGLVFKKGFLSFGFYGAILGVLICLLSVAPVIAFQRIKQQVRTMVDGASLMWGNLAIVIGILGLIAWGIRLLFF